MKKEKTFAEKVLDFQMAGGERMELTKEVVTLKERLLEEEYQELQDARKANDRVEMLDAIIDYGYVWVGYKNIFEFVGMDKRIYGEGLNELMKGVITIADQLGFTFEQLTKGSELVHESNMSKFCDTEEEAVATVGKYKNKGVEAHYKQITDKFVIRRSSDNKTLKSINYKPVNLLPLLQLDDTKVETE